MIRRKLLWMILDFSSCAVEREDHERRVCREDFTLNSNVFQF